MSSEVVCSAANQKQVLTNKYCLSVNPFTPNVAFLQHQICDRIINNARNW